MRAVVALCAASVVCGCEGPQAPESPATQGAAEVDHRPALPSARVRVAVELPGASPGQIEQDVTVKIEAAAMALTHVTEVRSVSREGVSEVDVAFAPDVAADEAMAAVRRAVASASAALPADAEEPTVTLMDTGPLAARIAVYGDVSNTALHATASRLRDRLMSIGGVGRVKLIGEPSEVRIEVSREALHRHGLTVKNVHQAIRARGVPPGGSTATRPVGQVATDMGRLVVAKVGAKTIRLADVAEISKGLSGETIVRVSGKPGALVQVHVLRGQDPAALARRIRAAVAGHQAQIPKGVRIDTYDCSPAGRHAGPLLRVAGDCPGIPIEDVEQRVTGPMRRRLQEIEGATSIATVSLPGRSIVHVPFKRGTELPIAIGLVRAELDEQPPAAWTIEPIPSIPIGRVDVCGGASADVRLTTAERLRQELGSVVGVARVDAPPLAPGKPMLEMAMKRERIAALGLTAKDVTDQVRSSLGAQETVIESASGRLRIVMRLRWDRGADVGGLKILAGGRHVPLNELVELRRQSRQSATQRVNARPCITLALFGNGVGKTEAVIDTVRKLAARAVDRSGDSLEITFRAAELSGG